ncbi:histidine phosphatase family protein [Macrococcus capreoli]
MKIFLIRHGQDTLNKRGGWSQEPLITEGVQQIKSLCESLTIEASDYIIASDLKRTRQTATIIKEQLSLNIDIIYDKNLREVNNGILAGMDNKVAIEKFPNLFWNSLEWDEAYPDGESPKIFFERVVNWYENFLIKYKDCNNIIIVTHQGVINALLCIINNKQFTNKALQYKIKPGQMIVVEIQ